MNAIKNITIGHTERLYKPVGYTMLANLVNIIPFCLSIEAVRIIFAAFDGSGRPLAAARGVPTNCFVLRPAGRNRRQASSPLDHHCTRRRMASRPTGTTDITCMSGSRPKVGPMPIGLTA